VTALAHSLTKLMWSAIGGSPHCTDQLAFIGSGGLASVFSVSDFASAAVATAILSVTELMREVSDKDRRITVDRRLSSMWFGASIRPIGWSLPAPWDPFSGNYRTDDGWIRLHTNAPRHRTAAEHILGMHSDKESMARVILTWQKTDLERTLIDAGGCAAEMRSISKWERHPQGRAVAREPLAEIIVMTAGSAKPNWTITPARPLDGLRVLDLTRVLAGPVASRFLAGYGADVLRIDPPGWEEPAVAPEVTLGKRCARMDLRLASDRAIFERLLSEADILLHGYRPGALDRLGLDRARRRELSPPLIDICLDAYGWSGPWATRRGFDSLVQMSSGIAETGMRRSQSEHPVALPVQALDHATGYLMAATAIRGALQRLRQGNGTEARLSLARTAKLLVDHPVEQSEPPFAAETTNDRAPGIEITDWGEAQRLCPPGRIVGASMHWRRPARNLGSGMPHWAAANRI
jgi:hypothetical protein